MTWPIKYDYFVGSGMEKNCVTEWDASPTGLMEEKKQ
jgi:hypothetical protein